MLKKEFIEMMHQDLETSNDENAKQVLECFEEILKEYPSSTEIDSSKTCEDCYKKMHAEAQKRAKNGSYCFIGESLKTFIIEYLGLEKSSPKERNKIKLEDFF